MKKVFLFLILILIILNFTEAFAYSKKFELIINAMGLEVTNESGKVLNEEIYNEYSLFVYGSPLDGYEEQRWKDVEDGRWTKNAGSWQGTGVRGEYWILGENVSSLTVHNHKFPADIEPPTDPTKWRYAYLSDAESSWNVKETYMDEVMKNYMLNTKLSRNDITYDITVNDIGTNKVRLDNFATWTTKGSVYTQRYDKNNNRWAANFMLPPMSADAKLESYAEFENGYYYEVNNGELDNPILIEYGAIAKDLTDYAKPEHVRQIVSKLFINDVLIDSISDKEKLNISNTINLDFSNIELSEVLNVRVESTLLTKFTTDGALVDVKEYTLMLKIDDEKEDIKQENIEIEKNDLEEYPDNPYINEKTKFDDTNIVNTTFVKNAVPPTIENIEIKVLENGKKSNIYKSKRQNKYFVCAGQTIEITATAINKPEYVTFEIIGDSSINTFDETTKRFEWTEPKQRKVNTLFPTLSDFQDLYSKRRYLKKNSTNGEESTYTIKYIIPYETKQTLESWKTLRDKTQDAFNIDTSKLFNRITKPYKFVFKTGNNIGKTTKTIEIDVFERWDTIYNRDISSYVK